MWKLVHLHLYLHIDASAGMITYMLVHTRNAEYSSLYPIGLWYYWLYIICSLISKGIKKYFHERGSYLVEELQSHWDMLQK